MSAFILLTSLFLSCSLALSKSVNAGNSASSKNNKLIAQSCRNTEIRPNGNQNRSFGRGNQWSTCNNYKLSFQNDGNLVLYKPGGAPVWATGTEGNAAQFSVQSDGNMVLYNGSGQPIWASNTDGNSGAFLALQTDGNLVVYRSNGQAIWASNTNGGQSRTRNASGEWLAARQPQVNPAANNPVKPISSLRETIPTCMFNGPCVGGGAKHTGVDYFTNPGSQVSAICDGVVKNAVTGGDIWNRFTIIEHSNCGGYRTLYAYYGHIDPSVGVGNSVRKGQGIGTVGFYSTNNHHLHFGLSTYYFAGGSNEKWGYQSGNLEQKGWINPESFKSKFNW